MEQVLDVFISQLEIKDGKKKRRMSTSNVPEQDSNNEINTNENLRRSGRKRIRPPELEKKRGVISKPKRLLDEYNSKDVRNYYLDKKIKRLPSSLETIFEEPNSENVMSTRKFKRCINFPSSVCLSRSKFKVKKRSMKAKKVSSRPKNKITMDMLFRKLLGIEENETTPPN